MKMDSIQHGFSAIFSPRKQPYLQPIPSILVKKLTQLPINEDGIENDVNNLEFESILTLTIKIN
jgi:hypothetical protein